VITRQAIIGSRGEDIATQWLRDKGYYIIERNWRAGRYEIDIIAEHYDTIHFVEVKTRNGDQYGYPSEAVTATKQLRIKRAAEQYLQGRTMQWNKLSFDVYEIMTELIEDCM
jgi:putative endonuclease